MNLPVLGHPINMPNMDEVSDRAAEQPPNNTLYINNLNEKVPMDELKDSLFNAFEEYGEIIDVFFA